MDKALAKYAETRAPRYTSYPTAAQFGPGVGATEARTWLGALAPSQPVSVYLHVPFCKEICWYCACNMKLGRRPELLRAYEADLVAELELIAAAAPEGLQVARIHWGGGTPTSLPLDALTRVTAELNTLFNVTRDCETAFEIDPRTFEPGMAEGLAALGTGRASLGVQEFDPRVQAAVNRIQPVEMVAQVVAELRAAGIGAINFDLIYGLPHQSVETITRTIDETVKLGPSRIALFGYAHVPWMSKRQRMLPEAALPSAAERFAQAETAAERLVAAGYVRVGLDHFALPDDGLARALRDRRLLRNFQGYTDDPVETVIGAGATAISAVPGGYYQNIGETGAWAREVRAGCLPVHRGVAVTPDDRLRRAVISELMCYLDVDLGRFCRAHDLPEGALDADLQTVQDFVDDGLAEIVGRRLRITDRGRPAMRVIAAAFDTHLRAASETRRHAVAV
ncbi:MAG: oxygen-independent coproporphyrinogen III oxidase [Pikeienuella sp.]